MEEKWLSLGMDNTYGNWAIIKLIAHTGTLGAIIAWGNGSIEENIAWGDGSIGENILGLKWIAYRGIMRRITVTHTDTVAKLLCAFTRVHAQSGNCDFHLFNAF